MNQLTLADRAVEQRNFVLAARLLEEAVAQAPSSFEIWMRLAAVRRMVGEVPSALAAVSSALCIKPRDPAALLFKGTLQELGGVDADEAYRAAVHFAGEHRNVPAAMRTRLDHAQAYCAAARRRRERRLDAALDRILATLSPTPEATSRACSFAEQLRDGEPVIFAELDQAAFLAPRLFPGVEAFAASYAAVVAEYLQLMADENPLDVPYIDHPDGSPLDQWTELNRSARWSAVHLVRGGNICRAALSRCPTTAKLFGGIAAPHIRSRSPNLMFSVLAPHTTIPPHVGVCNARLVLHIPLIIPPDCGIRVGDTTREWEPGQALAFNDTVEHTAWNGSDETRVVLIGDLWHPDLSTEDRLVLSELLAHGTAASTH